MVKLSLKKKAVGIGICPRLFGESIMSIRPVYGQTPPLILHHHHQRFRSLPPMKPFLGIIVFILRFADSCQHFFWLAPLHFLLFPFMRKNKVVARKEGRGARKASAGKELCPKILLGFRRMGRAARAPGHAKRVTPLQRTQPARGEERACPPDPRNEACLMVFARHALPSGPGKA